MKLKEALKIMQLDEKDPNTLAVVKRTIALLYYLKPGEKLDLLGLRLLKIGNDAMMLESDIDLGLTHQLESENVIKKKYDGR